MEGTKLNLASKLYVIGVHQIVDQELDFMDLPKTEKVLKKTFTALKVSVFGVFLVRIFPYSYWKQRDTPYISILS